MEHPPGSQNGRIPFLLWTPGPELKSNTATLVCPPLVSRDGLPETNAPRFTPVFLGLPNAHIRCLRRVGYIPAPGGRFQPGLSHVGEEGRELGTPGEWQTTSFRQE